MALFGMPPIGGLNPMMQNQGMNPAGGVMGQNPFAPGLPQMGMGMDQMGMSPELLEEMGQLDPKQLEVMKLILQIEMLELQLNQQNQAGDQQGAQATQQQIDQLRQQLAQLMGLGQQNPQDLALGGDPIPQQIPENHPYYNQGAPGTPTGTGGAEAPGGPEAPGTAPGAAPNAEPLRPEDMQGGTPMGRELASIAYQHATDGTGDGRHCYRNVADDLAKVGINVSGMSAYMAADQLARNDKVREVKGVSQDQLRELPPGAVVVWNRGGGHEHGHISVALGNGKEASDVIRNQITNYGTSYRVFLPNDQPARAANRAAAPAATQQDRAPAATQQDRAPAPAATQTTRKT